MSAVEKACNLAGTRAHYSVDLLPRNEFPEQGRHGNAICCSKPGWTVVYDQQFMDMTMPPGWRKRRVIEDMPLCKKCAKLWPWPAGVK